MKLDAATLPYRELNALVRASGEDCEITGCLGHRFLAAGSAGRRFLIRGTPGNALGAYLNGSYVEVDGNAQDAVGDTMNAGTIVVRGSVGDTAGYAMRGGAIYVRDNAGYRAGVHMKEYEDKLPVMVIGGRTGSFLGEYQAGGIILVLGLHGDGRRIVGNFPCAGMHGGRLFLRSDCREVELPRQVTAHPASPEELAEIGPYIAQYCRLFGREERALLDAPFTVVTPDSSSPYRQMYVGN